MVQIQINLHFVAFLVTILVGSVAGMPMRQALELAGGIREFINGVRSAFGRAGEFAQQNCFDYSNVYNSLLQYTVMNTYLERQNSELIRTQLEETALLREQTMTVTSNNYWYNASSSPYSPYVESHPLSFNWRRHIQDDAAEMTVIGTMSESEPPLLDSPQTLLLAL